MKTPRLIRDGQAPKPGIVHLGPGAFFRAFNAVYTQDAMDANGGDWGIIAVSLKSPRAHQQLVPQGGVYHAVELGPDGEKPRRIDAITQVLVAPEDPEQVIAAMADEAIRIVSLTITEKGYCLRPATGLLDQTHPDIAHDLTSPDKPVTAAGYLVAALERRQKAGIPPFTVLSCDNLPANGARARSMVVDLAAARDPTLAIWIEENVSFPATMVDRITPATSSEDVLRLSEVAGIIDEGAVFHEPFCQWVIEDNFVSGRPNWSAGGAQFVQDVEPFEIMKLRCLNGTHSSLAYLGYLAGHKSISETVADPMFAKFTGLLWNTEILPTVTEPVGQNLADYTKALMRRYQNPAIRHSTWQIAMDGSQKLPQRLLATMADNLASGCAGRGLCLAVAAWMMYVGGIDEAGQPIDVRDPMADRLKAAFDTANSNAEKVAALLSFEEIFPASLVTDDRFQICMKGAFECLAANGARQAIEKWVIQRQ